MISKKNIFPLSAVFIGIFVFFLYAPIQQAGFVSDDFWTMCGLKQTPVSLISIFSPISDHLMPVFRLLLRIQIHLFGYNPQPFYIVNILLHIGNALLTMLLMRKLTSNDAIAVLSGFIFGISAAHWRVPVWITTQGQELATFWMLLSAIFFLKSLKEKKLLFYILSVLSHLLMMLSFTVGFVFPIFIFFITLTLKQYGKNETHHKNTYSDLFKNAIPYICNIILFFLMRKFLIPNGSGFLSASGGIINLIRNIPLALQFFGGGLFFLVIFTYTGAAYTVKVLTFPVAIVYSVAILSLIISHQFYPGSKIKKYRGIIFTLIGCVALMIAIPIFPRLHLGLSWFITRARYVYIPGPFIAGAIAILIYNARIFHQKDKKFLNIEKLITVFFVIYMAGLHCLFIRHKIHDIVENTSVFDSAAANYIKKMRINIDQSNDKIFIVKRLLFFSYASWNVDTELLAKNFLSEKEVEKIVFIGLDNINNLDLKKNKIFLASPNGALRRITKIDDKSIFLE